MILTSCNTYIKPEGAINVSQEPNDTLFLAEAYGYSKFGQEIAGLASLNASDQKIRIFAEKAVYYKKKSSRNGILYQGKRIFLYLIC